MGGLLYKDFISINRAKKVKLTWFLAILTVAYVALRVMFPGTSDIKDFIVKTEQGEIINVMDAFFLMVYACQIIVSLTFVSVSKVMGNDEKSKIKGYIATMPLEKNTYVASKYVFIGVAAYVMMSIDYIWGVTCVAFCRSGRLQDIATLLNSSIVSIISIVILLASIELPLYIGVGREKAKRVMIVLWSVIALVIIGFLMFGDLKAFSNWDITVLLDYVERHKTAVFILQSMGPAIILAIYYLSYRISCYIYNKKEAMQ